MSHALATEQAALIGALEFYIDSGVRDFCMDSPEDMYGWSQQAPPSLSASPPRPASPTLPPAPETSFDDEHTEAPLGKSELIIAAQKALENVDSIDALKAMIAKFDGLSIQKTASHIVFAEGTPTAPIMIVN